MNQGNQIEIALTIARYLQYRLAYRDGNAGCPIGEPMRCLSGDVEVWVCGRKITVCPDGTWRILNCEHVSNFGLKYETIEALV